MKPPPLPSSPLRRIFGLSLLTFLLGLTLPVAGQSDASCGLAVRLDAVGVSSNIFKRGFAALLDDAQNPTIYARRQTSFSGSNKRDGQDCFSCHHESSQNTAETWEFTSLFSLIPTNTARSGNISYLTILGGLTTKNCTSTRSTSGPDTWSNPACTFAFTSNSGPVTVLVSNLTASSYLLILTNYTSETNGARIETIQQSSKVTTDLAVPYSLNDFLGTVTNGINAASFPDWTNATRYGVAERGGANVLTPSGEYTDFAARAGKFKYRIVFLGPRDKRAVLRWSEVFTPNGGGAVTNAVFTNEVVCTGSEQMATFPGGGTERTVGPPPTAGKTEVFLHNSWDCGGPTCHEMGGLEVSTGSLDARIGLGRTTLGEPAGFLYIHHAGSTITASPSLLNIFANHGVRPITNASVLRQVLAPQGLADIVTTGSSAFEIRFYANPGPFTNGLHQPVGGPFTVLRFENPGQNPVAMNITNVTASPPVVYLTGWSASDNGWAVTSPGQRTEVHGSATAGGLRTETLTYRDTSGVIAYQEVNVYRQFGGVLGDLLVTNKIGPDSAPLVTSWNYFTNAATDGASLGRLKEVVRPDGGWERYEYTNGRPAKIISVFTNAAPGAAESASRVTLHAYAPVSGADNGLLETNTPRTTIEYLLGAEVGRSYRILSPGQVVEIQCQTPGASATATDNLFQTNLTYAVPGYDGIVERRANQDGTVELRFQPTPRENVWLTNVVLTGAPTSHANTLNEGTRTVTIINPHGQTILTEATDIASVLVLSRQTYAYPDNFSRPSSVTHLDGTVTSSSYDCCGLESSTDADGVTTTYTYDGLHRAADTTRLGITNRVLYNAASQVRTNLRVGVDGSVHLLSRATFDLAGRQTSATDAMTNTTYFTNVMLTLGSSNYTLLPDTGTRIEVAAADGSPLRVSGTAAYPMRYDYGVEAEGGVSRRFTREIKLDRNGSDTPEWSKTYFDLVGRPYKTVFPDSAAALTVYNLRGQVARQVDPDAVTTAFAYNELGERLYTTNGSDRVTHTVTFAADDGVPVRRSLTRELDDAGNWITTRTTDVSTDGLYSWDDAFGLLTTTATVYGPAGARTLTRTAPDNTQTVQTYQDGRLVSSVTLHASLGTLHSQTYGYDAHGRSTTVTDARNGTSTVTFNNADQIETQTTPPPGPGQSGLVTRQFYDPLGRLARTVLPDNSSTTNEFHPTGDLKKTAGSLAYPTEYLFDAQGRLTNLTTWQNHSADSGKARTRWTYSTDRGFLVAKAHEGTNGPAYTFTPAGRIRARAWVRGIAAVYDYTTNGDLRSITYSNHATLNLTNTFDRRGRLKQVQQGTNLTTLLYNDAGQLVSESRNGLIVTNSFDSFLRLERQTLKVATPFTNFFAYDDASRLLAVSNSAAASATYGYLANSALVGAIDFAKQGTTRLKHRRDYDALNRLTDTRALAVGGASFRAGYGYNALSQRTNMTLADGARWRYQYDVRGQLNLGKKSWSDGVAVAGGQFEYSFDDIGNRTQTKAGGNASGTGLRTATYTPTLLNQQAQRTLSGAFDVLGSAPAGATVTVNGAATYRHGDFWQNAPTNNNTTGAVAVGISIQSVSNTVTLTSNATVFLPRTPETFVHDADGNLVTNGQFSFGWDAENRLTSFTPLPGTPTNIWQSGRMSHDHLGRRVSKAVSNYVNGVWQLAFDQRFAYDGWNLLAILTSSNTPLYSFTWGSDLSGTRQGAGGVGGLISMTVHSGSLTGVYFYVFDGNGNVMALVNATTGEIAAHYEYAPFGALLRATGPMAFVNPFRWSTKFQDDETGFLYYGFRYYDPREGRWLSRDPIEEKGGLNIYAFIGNDSVNWVDLLGLIDFAPGFEPPPTLPTPTQPPTGPRFPSERPSPIRPPARQPIPTPRPPSVRFAVPSPIAVAVVLLEASTVNLNSGEEEALQEIRSYAQVELYETELLKKQPDKSKLNAMRVQLQKGRQHLWSIEERGHFRGAAENFENPGVLKVQLHLRLFKMSQNVLAGKTDFPKSSFAKLKSAIVQSSQKILSSPSVGPQGGEIRSLRTHFQDDQGCVYRIDVVNDRGINLRR